MDTIERLTACIPLTSNHAYRLRLLPDEDILSAAEAVYSPKLLKTKNNTLDSGLFGASLNMSDVCTICRQRMTECPGHYAVIQLPFPIFNTICQRDFTRLIQILCPVCSHFVIPHANDALKLPPSQRFKWLREETASYLKNNPDMFQCAVCRNHIRTIKVTDPETIPHFHIDVNDSSEQVLPQILHTILQNFTQLDVLGFNPTYHPRNFMTSLIPIIPTKLRQKACIGSESAITSYYKYIIDEIIPELDRIYKLISTNPSTVVFEKGDIATSFNRYYDKLVAYHLLITDIQSERKQEAALNTIEKRDRKHVDKSNALVSRFKSKETTIFNKGIVASRHNVSARTVLGGATDTPIKCINVPHHIAIKLSKMYTVYKQNLKAMRQLVAAMNDPSIVNDVHIPRVLGVMDGYNPNRSDFLRIDYSNATSQAALLKPGDRLAISLLTGDFVMQNRFPAVREESWSSFQVMKDDNTIITIPLSDCDMKMADFDGDEAQIYVPSSHYTDAESLLLHSTFTQYIAYKDGNPAIWFPWSGDAAYGLDKFRQGRTSIILGGQYHPEYSVIKMIESYLPSDLNYVDSKLEIVNGKLPSDRTTFRNADFFKYFASLYSSERAQELMDRLIQLAYDVNIDQGCSLGFDIRIYGTDTRKAISDIIAETEAKMYAVEASNERHKDIIQMLAVESQKSRIKKLLIDGAKGTEIDRLGYTTLRQEEYYQTVVMLDHVVIDGYRIQSDIADYTRTCVAFPRHSVDPRAYGYIDRGYNADVSPVAHFYECKQQRKALFQRGKGTSDQGYLSKRMAVAYGYPYVDHNGALVDNFRLISTVYGCCGLDPRLYVRQPLIDIDMEPAAFAKKYPSKRLQQLHHDINEYRKMYATFTSFIGGANVPNIFAAGFDYEQYIDRNTVNGATSEKDIDAFIERIEKVYCPPAVRQRYALENLKHHEYYFRTKMASRKCGQDVLDKLYDVFVWSMAGGGEPAGMKASLATSEPLTQASLHAIHHAGGGGATEERIQRSVGLRRFLELLAGDTPKNTVLTFKLYNDSKENCLEFANEQETFYFNDIWSRLELEIAKLIDNKVIAQHPDVDFDHVEVSNYFITSIWNLSSISAYGIHVVDIINRLMENYNEIMFVTGFVLNMSEFMAYIYFKRDVSLDRIHVLMEEWGTRKPSTIVHGKYLKNCCVTENKNDPGHWLVEANEVKVGNNAMENLIYDERVDPRGCRTTDPTVNMKLFGVFETATRHYEELVYTATNLSDTSGVLYRHYKVLADTIFVTGRGCYAKRTNLGDNKTADALRLLNFETPKDMMTGSMKYGVPHPIAEPVSATVFGDQMALGSGVSRVTLYVP